MGTLNAKDSRQGGYQLSRLVAKEVFRQLGNFPARRAVVVLKLTQASKPSPCASCSFRRCICGHCSARGRTSTVNPYFSVGHSLAISNASLRSFTRNRK